MSGMVVIVIAALLGWCAISVALALVVGRRLGGTIRATSPVAPPSTRPVDIRDARQRDRRTAA